jgi:hypothetical protein
VKVNVARYPFEGATGLEVSEETEWGWVVVRDVDQAGVGTFPDYTTQFDIAPIGTSERFRARWEVGVGSYDRWLYDLEVVHTPTDEQVEAFTQAIIAKATRIIVMGEAPLGTWGELTEFGIATVKPDYQIKELLYGLTLRNWDVDLTGLVDTDDVVRAGLQSPEAFPAARVPDVQRAIDTAVAWVAHYLLEGVALA